MKKGRDFDRRSGSSRRISLALTVVLLVSLAVALSAVPAEAGVPAILTLTPDEGPVGTFVTIRGGNFGAYGEDSGVTFNGVEAVLISWNAAINVITTTVPEGATTGPVVVRNADGESKGKTFKVTEAPSNAPRISRISPTSGPVGTDVTITGTNFQQAGVVTFDGVPATQLSRWTNTSIIAAVPQDATSGNVVVSTIYGSSNGVRFKVTPAVPTAKTWYLAEGCTAYGFETYVLIANTNPTAASVNITYNTSLGNIPRLAPVGVPSNSRLTLYLNEEVPNVNVSTTLSSDVPIVCERAMYWNDRIEGHDSIGVIETSKAWYLAEGCTAGGFETWLLIQNPGQQDARVEVTYMTSKGVVRKPGFNVAAGGRYTIDVSKDVGQCDVSTKVESDQPVIAERAMYWDGRRGGHDSIGVTKGSETWYLAEGSTAWGFETWLLLQNPTGKSAKVDVTYMTAGGPVRQPRFTMTQNSRHSIKVNNYVPDTDTSIKVESDQPVIAERAMYWDNGTGRAGHETVGVTGPAKTIYLAEGSTAWGFETYVCIQNPNKDDTIVNIIYLTNEGPVQAAPRTVKGRSRITVFANEDLPDRDASVRVEASVPIMAERAVYWHEKGAGHVSIGWAP